MMKQQHLLLLLTVLFYFPLAMANDRYEGFNRDVENFNSSVDHLVIKPTTEAYVDMTADPIRIAVSNFVNNLDEPITLLNDALQGKTEKTIQDTARFIFNTTFGLFGLIDIATPMGLERHTEDFGQTFASWGWTDSNYLNLPLLGPSTLRDATGKPFSFLMTYTNIPLTAARILSVRESLMPVDPLLDTTADRYAFIRDAYLQQRNYLIHDGQSAAKEKFKDFDFSE